MTNTDEQFATILARYGEPAEGNVWQVEGQAFIHHKTLERIAAQAFAIRGRADGPSATARAKPNTKGKIQCRTTVHKTASTTRGMRTDRACSVYIGTTALQGIERVHLDANRGDHLTVIADTSYSRQAQVVVAELVGTVLPFISADVP